jgi:hypothetical protein
LSRFLSPFFGKVMKSWSWILLIIMAILIKFASTQPLWVEKYYSNSLYRVISKVQRAVFGWMPISIGDLFYVFLGVLITVKTIHLIRTIIQKKFTRQYLLNGLKQLIFFFLFMYVIFYSFWGLNYSRKGIAYQLGLEVKEYTKEDLDTLITRLQERVNFYAKHVDTLKRKEALATKTLFRKAEDAYLVVKQQYSFLKYSPESIKPSLYKPFNHLLGVTGYYNPFTGEAQINTAVPAFLHPFVITHEIGHQLGYAKENEANFVGFLACKAYNDTDFSYSMYYDMYFYAIREMFRYDIEKGASYRFTLDTLVKRDYREWRAYLLRKKNFVEPLISKVYDGYLKANNQPLGKDTYNDVVGWLIAYYKKYGLENL